MDGACAYASVAPYKIAQADLVLALGIDLQQYLRSPSHAATPSSFNCIVEMLSMALMTNRSQHLT